MNISSYRRLAVCLVLLALVMGGAVTGGPVAARPAPDPARPAACTGQQFTDVCPTDWYYPFVMNLFNIGAISGYADHTFRPNNQITRGQIMKVIVIATGLTAPVPGTNTFADVPPANPFFPWIEIGVAHAVVSGYSCGAAGEPCDPQNRPYFRPAANVNRGQMAKMIVNARGWAPHSPTVATFADVPATSPYFAFVERVASYGVISGYGCAGGCAEPCPGLYFRPYNDTTRAQASKIIDIARTLVPTPTPTGTPPTPTRTATPPAGTQGVFPADNIWNRNIAALPTHPLSNAYVNSIGAGTNVHADFGSGTWAGGPIGIPYVSVPLQQACVPVSFYWPHESDPGPYPVPTNAPIEGGPNGSGDRHVLVLRGNVLYEMYDSQPQADGSWDAASGAIWPLNSNALRPETWTSADAAGLPIYPGLVRYDEVASGVIRHALRFTAPQTQQAYLWPARHQAGASSDPNLPPMGLRMRLKASVNISAYPPQARVILQALKDYGMFLADNGSPWFLSGAPDERWDNDVLHAMDAIQGSDFEAVDEASLMIDPNSAQSR